MIYIDYSKNGYSHLIADSISELHDFAKELGIKRCWFENKKGKNKPHYDIKEEYVKKAIELGAIQIPSKELVVILKKIYEK